MSELLFCFEQIAQAVSKLLKKFTLSAYLANLTSLRDLRCWKQQRYIFRTKDRCRVVDVEFDDGLGLFPHDHKRLKCLRTIVRPVGSHCFMSKLLGF